MLKGDADHPCSARAWTAPPRRPLAPRTPRSGNQPPLQAYSRPRSVAPAARSRPFLVRQPPSLDFAEFEALQVAGDWDRRWKTRAAEAPRLQAAGAELFLPFTNTMHKSPTGCRRPSP